MFLDRLDHDQQGVLLSLATQLMAADGQQRAEESALLAALRQQMPSTVTPAQVTKSELSGLFPTQPARAALVLELLGMALVDGEYHPTEEAFVDSIADVLGIAAPDMSDMHSWVTRQFALVREAEQFMEG